VFTFRGFSGGFILFVIPVVTYSNAGLQEKLIKKENKGKSGKQKQN
jgi:hypothetical protein